MGVCAFGVDLGLEILNGWKFDAVERSVRARWKSVIPLLGNRVLEASLHT